MKVRGTARNANLLATAIWCPIASSFSMRSFRCRAIYRSSCFHKNGQGYPCHASNIPYMIAFGALEVILSQIQPDQIWRLSYLRIAMFVTYSTIGLGLGVQKVRDLGHFGRSLKGIRIGGLSSLDKMWKTHQALGIIAVAFSWTPILSQIQGTIRTPSDKKTMKNGTLLAFSITTTFYLLYACVGCAGFANNAPGNLLTDFGFYEPYWLLDIANAAIAIHFIGAYQVLCRPLFTFVEEWCAKRWPNNNMINKEYQMRVPWVGTELSVNVLRLVWRSIFVICTTMLGMLFPFFNNVVALIGALGFWLLTVYFPVKIYIEEKRINPWTPKWVGMQILNVVCCLVSIAGAFGAVVGLVQSLNKYKPFHTNY